MSHEIETHGDQAAAVFAREDAWHKLGTTLPDCFTAEEAMTVGHLGGWDVRKVPLSATEITPDGVTTIEVPDKWATVRTNPFTGASEALGVVGNIWTPVQNEEHCETLNTLVEDSGAIFDTAGSLRGGREVFITMKLPRTLMVGGVDRVDLNLAALNNHEGTGSFILLLTPTRVVCKNTQVAAIRNAQARYSIRHTKNARSNIAAAREALGLTFAYVDAFEAEAERMIQESLSAADFWTVLEDAWGADDDATDRQKDNAKRQLEDIMALFTDSPTNDAIRGTRWAAYQAITEYVDHFIPVRGKGDEATIRAERLLTGTELAGIKADAFDLLRVNA